jgi:potassium-transporting ATPase KdpC subunit
MKDLFFTALRVALVTLFLTGLVYPLAMTGASQLLFPWRADGSLIDKNGDPVRAGSGRAIGSALLAQGFQGAAYFQPRPSAAGSGYDAGASSGSNLGPTAKKLQDRVQADVARLLSENPDAQGPLPVELVTTSASGLDPHLSPAGALWQIPRIAKARGVEPSRLVALVEEYTSDRTLGLLGEPRINVLQLNLALDARFGESTP